MRKLIFFTLIPIGLSFAISGCEAKKKELMEGMEKEKAKAMEKMEKEKAGAKGKMEMTKNEWKKKVKENCPKKKFKDKKARKDCIAALKK